MAKVKSNLSSVALVPNFLRICGVPDKQKVPMLARACLIVPSIEIL